MLSKKALKRQTIAKSCCNMFIQNNLDKISISSIAREANIGKGTIYEYFTNKEDIVFELMSCLQQEYDKTLEINILNANTTYEKVLVLFDIFLSNNETVIMQKEIYKKFLTITLANPTKNIKEYHTTLRDKYILVLNRYIKDNYLAQNIYDTIIGFFIASNSVVNYNLEDNIKTFLKQTIK
jgi:AcrR family transcriptional regulator